MKKLVVFGHKYSRALVEIHEQVDERRKEVTAYLIPPMFSWPVRSFGKFRHRFAMMSAHTPRGVFP